MGFPKSVFTIIRDEAYLYGIFVSLSSSLMRSVYLLGEFVDLERGILELRPFSRLVLLYVYGPSNLVHSPATMPNMAELDNREDWEFNLLFVDLFGIFSLIPNEACKFSISYYFRFLSFYSLSTLVHLSATIPEMAVLHNKGSLKFALFGVLGNLLRPS